MDAVTIIPLTQEKFADAVRIALDAQLDTKEEIEHHLAHIDAHSVAIIDKVVVGVIGWYQDTVHYANAAMGDLFPGKDAYWVGFFAVDTNYRNRGIGAQLLDTLMKTLKEKNVKELWVSSVPETKSYYEKHGFVLVSTGQIQKRPKFFLKKMLV